MSIKINYSNKPYGKTAANLVLFSNDSLLNEERSPSLFFSPDSQFDENTSTYLDYENYSLTSWLNIGKNGYFIHFLSNLAQIWFKSP